MEDALLSGRVKLMPMIKRFARMALLLLGLVAEANSQAGAVPDAEWKKLATPERAGWSATRLAEIRGYVEEMGSTSAMIVQHGVVVAAWGDVGHRSNLHSCRKSLLNALIGIAAGREVGADVEQKRPMEDLYGMARSVMSEGELQDWERLAPESRLDAFYRVWTRKEAYLKAIGLGLFRNLQEVTVPMAMSAGDGDGDGAWRVRDSGRHAVWTVRDIGVWDGYSAAVCWEGADRVRVITHDFDLMGM